MNDFSFLIVIVCVWIIWLVITLISSHLKKKKRKNVYKWDYKCYKDYKCFLDYSGIDLLEKLANSNLRQDEMKKIIDEFNSLDKTDYPLTLEMVEFYKQFVKETEPVRQINNIKRAFVKNLK